MKFFIGMAVGAVLAGGAGVYLLEQQGTFPVRFPAYHLMDLGNYVRLEGSLYGEGEDRPVNNFYSIQCWEERQECRVASVDEIGRNHVGLFVEETLPATVWNDAVIEVSSKELAMSGNACNFYEIEIDRSEKTATYVRRPNENAEASCAAQFEEKVMRWRFDNGPAWKHNADGAKRS